MLGLFKKRKKKELSFEGLTHVKVDMHSHLLPGIDDGAANMEESIEMIKYLVDLGFEKLIMTPHIMSDFYKNTPEIVLGKLEEVREECQKQGIQIELEAAAEYYLDEGFIRKLENQEPLLTFGDQYILFETSFMNESQQFNHAVFTMQSQGLKPILAHPERYAYNFGNIAAYEEIHERGVLLQINLMSLTGYYGPPQKKMAQELIEKDLVSFIGTDCHKIKHAEVFKIARKTAGYHTLLQRGLKNNTLLTQVSGQH